MRLDELFSHDCKGLDIGIIVISHASLERTPCLDEVHLLCYFPCMLSISSGTNPVPGKKKCPEEVGSSRLFFHPVDSNTSATKTTTLHDPRPKEVGFRKSSWMKEHNLHSRVLDIFLS